ncbi:MAG: DUF4167 domain-containing protein, partial [Pseudomonadota bacterium]
MRPNNTNKRTRSRSRGKNTNPLARSYESNGPDVKIRGSAIQVADKYAQLARDAQSAGDRIMAESYYQHAEHYYRIVAQAYEQNNQNQQQGRDRRDDNDRRDDSERRDDNDRRDDQDRGNRDDRQQQVRGTGEQPTINGFDGMENDDEGVRRALRINGHNGNGATQGEGAEGESVTGNGHSEADSPSRDDDAGEEQAAVVT